MSDPWSRVAIKTGEAITTLMILTLLQRKKTPHKQSINTREKKKKQGILEKLFGLK